MRRIKFFKRKSPAEIAIHLLMSAIFMCVALSYLYLLVWAFIQGFRNNTDIIMKPFSLPESWQWRNYLDVFTKFEIKGHTFLEMLFNSIYFSVGYSVISIFTTITFAYACTKYKFPGSEWIYPIILVMQLLPLFGTGGATYKLLHNLGLIDSYARLILAVDGMSVSFLYFRAYFQNLSWTYAESAMIDGANDFQIYFRVMLPQAKPIFGALFLTTWLTAWNDYKGALVYIPNLPTLPVGIYQFERLMIYRAELEILFAGIILVSLPPLILFVVFNKMITENVSLGGIKG